MIDILRHLGRRLRSDQRGAGLIEYCLLMALIALVCFGALTYFGNSGGDNFERSCNKIAAAGGDEPAECDR